MNILLTNDDGYLAPGIQTLFEHLKPHYQVSIVAPDRERSAASNSLTLNKPLRVVYQKDNVFAVDGTPTDCVHLGLGGILDHKIDLVVSGINRGANICDDVHYSGTVAAAMEGRFLGLPAIAVSLNSFMPDSYEAAAKVVLAILKDIKNCPIKETTILNVNVPNVEFDAIEGYEITKTGSRHQSEPIVADKDPRGNVCYWVGAPGKENDTSDGTDFNALLKNKVSITPIKVDMTGHDQMANLKIWLNK